MANTENLLRGNPETQFKSGRRAVEMGKKGGKKFAENLKNEKTLLDGLKKLMSLPIQDESTKDFIRGLGYNTEELTNGMAINVALFQEALKGNTKAYELIRDTLGEKPSDKIQIEEAPQIVLKRPDK